jgi:hypothetical protein
MPLGFLRTMRISRDKAQEPETQDDPSRLETLRKQFSVAKRGTFCRTVAFKSAVGGDALGVTHLQAVEDPNTFRWMLQEVTAQPNMVNENLPVGATIDRRRTRASGLTFFEAVESLGNFERLQDSRGNVPDGQTAEQLGAEHYKTFAEAEGIVFDLNGRPHPTQQGMIVTDGDFMPGAEKSAIANYKEPLPDRVWTAGALSQLFDQVRASQALDGLTLLMGESAQWRKVLGINRTLYAYTNAWRLHRDRAEHVSVSGSTGGYVSDEVRRADVFSKHWNKYSSIKEKLDSKTNRILKGMDAYENGSQRRYAFFQTLQTLRQSVPDNLDKDGKAAFEKMCQKHEFYFLLFYSNRMMHNLLNESDASEIKHLRSLVETGAERMKKLGTKLGYDPAHIQAFKAAIYSGEVLPDESAEIKAFIDACDKKLAEIKKAADEQRLKIATPPYSSPTVIL